MKRWKTAFALLLLAASPAAASEPDEDRGVGRGARVAFDLVLMRPFDVVHAAAGLAVAPAAYLIAAPIGATRQVTDLSVRDPMRRAFRRPLGEL